jgi:hypothetical protein
VQRLLPLVFEHALEVAAVAHAGEAVLE